jgi:hypothetical protein
MNWPRWVSESPTASNNATTHRTKQSEGSEEVRLTFINPYSFVSPPRRGTELAMRLNTEEHVIEV